MSVIKIQISLLSILFFVLSYSYAQNEDILEKQWMVDLAKQESKSFWKKQDINSTHTANYDIKFHRMKFYIDPDVYRIEGEITTYFVPKTGIDKIKFDFTNIIGVDEVIYNGNSINFNQSNDILTCTFPSELIENKLDSIKVIYSGIPEENNDSFFRNHHNGVPIISTLSEPYGAKDWWPCKQDLTDKIDSIEVIIESPIKYRSVSNGLLLSENIIADKRTCIWKHKYPIPAYLIAISVTDYVDFTINYENIEGNILPIQNHVYPENEASAKVSIEYTKKAMEIFETLFEIYPYSDEKYGHAQFSWGGGMEHTTVSFMGHFSEDLIAHELAHQWFGDKVTCGSWSDIWLNEGFATYLTGLTYEHYKGNFNGWLTNRISHITQSTGGSVYVNDTTSIGTIFSSRLSYSKGAMVLHMLRWKMGDELFFQAIKNYLKDENLSYGYAKTEDLISICETVYGKNLSNFFDQWIYKEGYPSYSLEWNQHDDNSLSLLFNQSQSHPSVLFFEMPVEILINGTGGETEYHRIEVNENSYKIGFDVGFEISSIEIDPNKWLISKNNSVLLNPELALDVFEKEKWTSRFKNNNTIVINTNNDSINNIEVFLFDLSGKIITTKKIHGNKIFLLNTGNISEGIYYIIIKTDNKFITKALLK